MEQMKETSKEQYAAMLREGLGKLRMYDFGNYDGIRKEFDIFRESSGLTLAEIGTSENELRALEARERARGMVNEFRTHPRRRNDKAIDAIIQAALEAVGTGREEIEAYKKMP